MVWFGLSVWALTKCTWLQCGKGSQPQNKHKELSHSANLIMMNDIKQDNLIFFLRQPWHRTNETRGRISLYPERAAGGLHGGSGQPGEADPRSWTHSYWSLHYQIQTGLPFNNVDVDVIFCIFDPFHYLPLMFNCLFRGTNSRQYFNSDVWKSHCTIRIFLSASCLVSNLVLLLVTLWKQYLINPII